MGLPREELALKFLRTYSRIFTVKEMKKVLNAVGIPADMEETRIFLDSNPNVLKLENNHYITHAGAFTGEIFSIFPTKTEYEVGVLVPGHRCMPFVESDRISSTLSFYINGKKIPSASAEFDSDDAIDMFMLYGEEYAPQYIASDPANSSYNLADRDFELPNKVRLGGIDLKYIAKRYNYRYGDRFLCCISNWDAGKINLMIVHGENNKFDKGESGEKRLLWYSLLEKKLLESFERHGPLGSIEEQLVNVIYENRSKLCVPYCGSIEEFLSRYTKKIGFEHYGVESRLWKKGETVPAFGVWNEGLLDFRDAESEIPFGEFVISSIPEYVFDQMVLNSFYKKNPDFEKFVMNQICQGEFDFDDKTTGQIILNLRERCNILSEGYNWFADQIIGPLREDTLNLYSKVAVLVHKIDYIGSAVSHFPSQEVIILAQIHNHLLRMIESFSCDPGVEKSADALKLSIEGMEWNFEEIRSTVETALMKEERSRFKLYK